MTTRRSLLSILLLPALLAGCGGGGGGQAEVAIEGVSQIACQFSAVEGGFLCATGVTVSITGAPERTHRLDVAIRTDLLSDAVLGSVTLEAGPQDGEHVVAIPEFVIRSCSAGLGLAQHVEAELLAGNDLAGAAIRYNLPVDLTCGS